MGCACSSLLGFELWGVLFLKHPSGQPMGEGGGYGPCAEDCGDELEEELEGS